MKFPESILQIWLFIMLLRNMLQQKELFSWCVNLSLHRCQGATGPAPIGLRSYGERETIIVVNRVRID